MFGRGYRQITLFLWPSGLFLLALASAKAGTDFRFGRDTFGFANQTVFEYREGHPRERKADTQAGRRYTRRCFVLCRAAVQFYKVARFDPRARPLDDTQLAARIRAVTRRPAWRPPLPENQRVVFTGYPDLTSMSKARGRVLQENIGLGWPTYFRVGNFRMVFTYSHGYQERTHQNLEAALARGELFIGYLTVFPSFTINHAVLFYARKPNRPGEPQRYIVYDPNHGERPRELTWLPHERAFSYEKDWDFVGGRVRVYQVYGKPLQ